MHSLWGVQSRATSWRTAVLFINSGSNEVVYQYADLHTFCQNRSTLNSCFRLVTSCVSSLSPGWENVERGQLNNCFIALYICALTQLRKLKGGPLHIFIIAISSAATEQSWYWLSHLKWLPSAWIGVLLFLRNGLLLDCGELLSLGEELLLELLLRPGRQEPLSEGDVGEHRGKRSTKLNRRLGAFLKKQDRWYYISINLDTTLVGCHYCHVWSLNEVSVFL